MRATTRRKLLRGWQASSSRRSISATSGRCVLKARAINSGALRLIAQEQMKKKKSSVKREAHAMTKMEELRISYRVKAL